jgi:hypothetical protein
MDFKTDINTQRLEALCVLAFRWYPNITGKLVKLTDAFHILQSLYIQWRNSQETDHSSICIFSLSVIIEHAHKLVSTGRL